MWFNLDCPIIGHVILNLVVFAFPILNCQATNRNAVLLWVNAIEYEFKYHYEEIFNIVLGFMISLIVLFFILYAIIAASDHGDFKIKVALAHHWIVIM